MIFWVGLGWGLLVWSYSLFFFLFFFSFFLLFTFLGVWSGVSGEGLGKGNIFNDFID
jgi:hypothetical protein